MWRPFLSSSVVFFINEGFYLLPSFVIVLFPGFFRFSDLLVFFVVLTFFTSSSNIIRLFEESQEASAIVTVGCILTLITAAMAVYSFKQPFWEGLLYVRHNFNYLLFFVFGVILYSAEDLKGFIRLMTVLVAFLAILAILQKFFPSVAIFSYESMAKRYTDTNVMRLGDYRLFFPCLELGTLFYCIALAQLLYSDSEQWVMKTLFVLLFAYIVIATMTRVHMFSIIFVTIIGFVTCRKNILKLAGIALIALVIVAQMLTIAGRGEGIAALQENRLAKIISYSMDKKEGSIQGRLFQNKMYLENFFKSPLVGVGTIKFHKSLSLMYRNYGIYSNNDLGYVKILAEYGLAGILWILWIYVYVYKRTKGVLIDDGDEKDGEYAKAICLGCRLFFVYVAISALTLPHFVEGDRILPLVLAMVFIEIAYRTVSENKELEEAVA